MGWGLWGAWELWGPQGLLPGPLSPPPGWLADRAHSSAWAHSHISGAGTWLVGRWMAGSLPMSSLPELQTLALQEG